MGQVRVVGCPGYRDRADEDAEGEDRFAFSDRAVGIVDEVSQYFEAFLHLTGVAAPGRAAGAGDIRVDAGHAAAGLGMIPMPRAEVSVNERRVSEAIFPGEVPAATEQVLPQLLTTDTIELEGNILRVIRVGQADTAESTVLYIPSLAALVTGDLANNEVHMMTAETGEPQRTQWIANLDKVAALEPTFVVAGHKKVENNNDPKIIGESQQYLRDFTRIAAEETTAANLVARIGRTLSRLGNPPHTLAFREGSHREECRLVT